MADVGLQRNFVDTQGISLTNVDDSLTYTQLQNLRFDIRRQVEKHELTDDTVQNVYSSYMNGIEGEITLTIPQWSALAALTVMTNGVLPNKIWEISWRDATNGAIATTFEAEMAILSPIDVGLGVLKVFFRLECNELVVIV